MSSKLRPFLYLFVALIFTTPILGYFFLLNEFKKSRPIPKKLSTESEFSSTEQSFFILDFKSGQGLRSLCDALLAKEHFAPCWVFRLSVRFFGDSKKLQAGRYRLENSYSWESLTRKLTTGDIYRILMLELTVPEGFTLQRIGKKLEEYGIKDAKKLPQLKTSQALLRASGIPEGVRSLEGFVYPSTYRFFDVMPSLEEVLRAGVQQFFKSMPERYEERLKEKGLSLSQGVTFASLIELETSHPDEKSMISEVIWRRLKSKNPLGIDAALIYGIPDYDGDIKWKHLKDSKNPYNLRIHKGLPPTPIASPDRTSLEAVLEPTNLGYFYYVLKPDGSKRHTFTKTLKDHQKEVKKLLKEIKK